MFKPLSVLASAVFLFSFLAACGGGGSSGSNDPSPPPQPLPGANQSPTADAGPNQTVDEGVQVNLAGTGSDPDGTIVSFSWLQVGGAQVAMSGANTSNASFTAPLVSSSETLEFRLQVIDDDNAIGSDTVQVTVSDVPPTSTANIGDLISSLNQRFALETSALESEQDTAQAQASASGNYLSGGYLSAARNRFINHLNSFFNFLYDEAIRLTDNGTFFSRPEIIAELDWQRSQWQTYLNQFLSSSLFNGHSTNDLDAIIRQDVLVAIDNAINNAISRLDASGRLAGSRPPDNQAPTANAGADQTANEGWTVSLSGSGTDADGFIVSFNWQQDSGTSVVITDADMAFASFVAPMIEAPQELIFRFVVTDDDGALGSDTVSITVNNDADPSVNQPPLADAGVDQTVNEGVTVNLTGLGTDSDGTIASYSWEQVGGTAVTISGGNSASASFTAPGVAATEDLVFRLTVTDNDGATGSDTVTITVNDVPPPTVLNWSIELNDPTGVLGITRPLLITGSLSNSPSSNVNLGIIGGFQGIPPGFDFEVSGFASTSTGYLFDWAPDGGESFINQFEGVDLSPGESFDFEFAKLAPNELVTSGTVYTTSLELQLYDAPRSGPMIGSSFDSISWTAVDDFGLVFVTSAPYAGGNLGGVSGADAICSQHAVDAGLGGTWTAWLSNPTINAKDRLAAAGALGPYRNTFNKIVALDLDDLTDGMLDISSGGFRYDENGQETNTRRYIWTSTDADGTAYLGGSCGTDWNDVNALGLVGDREQDDSGWTRVTFPPDGRLQSCSDELSIYCFKGNAVP